MTVLRVVRLTNVPIFEQLVLEEVLYRKMTNVNAVLVATRAAARPTVVCGAAQHKNLDRLVEMDLVERDAVPVVQRFTGGGTVLLEPRTVVASLVGNDAATVRLGKRLGGQSIMAWMADRVYAKVFGDSREPFSLRVQDYCLGERKIGGNAQALARDRFVHHTSFLYDYDEAEMAKYLRTPEKQPEYRQQRPHADFITRAAHLFPSPEAMADAMAEATVDALLASNADLDVHEMRVDGGRETDGDNEVWRAVDALGAWTGQRTSYLDMADVRRDLAARREASG